ncbi:MAG TPA: hypothetical protein ENK45_02520 [Aliiroseovarius sp.]|nr:hypothetical protein [Aliiroseovarius sp.]
MATTRLTRTALREGIWRGELLCDGRPPAIEVRHLDRPLDGVQVEAAGEEGRFTLTVPVPAGLLSDGVQTFVIVEQDSGDKLGSFAIIAGAPADDDLRAEIDLLRAELDMLKRAFRRQCTDNM